MGALEERVAYLEGRGEEHAAASGDVRADIRDLRAEMNRRFDRIDERFDRIDGRFDRIDGRFDRIDGRFDRIDGRFERLETRFDTRFMWLVGFQFATFMAIIAALLNGYFR
jgi:archaellum component FlaC